METPVNKTIRKKADTQSSSLDNATVGKSTDDIAVGKAVTVWAADENVTKENTFADQVAERKADIEQLLTQFP